MEDATASIDDVWEAQRDGRDVSVTPFYRLAAQVLSTPGAALICWCGSDFIDLPRVASLAEMERELVEQTKAQPADLFMLVNGPPS